MKSNSIKQLTLILPVLFLTPMVNYAQDSDINKDFNFEKSSKTETIQFDVNDETKKLAISFEGGLKEGSMKIKISDPDGNIVSGFSLECTVDINGNSTVGANSNSASGVSVSSSSGNASASTSSSVSVTSGSGSASTSISGHKKTSKSKQDKKSSSSSYQKTESDESGARGVMNKEIENPLPGTWKYSIVTNGASGQLSAKIKLH